MNEIKRTQTQNKLRDLIMNDFEEILKADFLDETTELVVDATLLENEATELIRKSEDEIELSKSYFDIDNEIVKAPEHDSPSFTSNTTNVFSPIKKSSKTTIRRFWDAISG